MKGEGGGQLNKIGFTGEGKAGIEKLGFKFCCKIERTSKSFQVLLRFMNLIKPFIWCIETVSGIPCWTIPSFRLSIQK